MLFWPSRHCSKTKQRRCTTHHLILTFSSSCSFQSTPSQKPSSTRWLISPFYLSGVIFCIQRLNSIGACLDSWSCAKLMKFEGEEEYLPLRSWMILRLSMSLWTTEHPSHLAKTVPEFQPRGLTLFSLVVLHNLQVKRTCRKVTSLSSKIYSALHITDEFKHLRFLLMHFDGKKPWS